MSRCPYCHDRTAGDLSAIRRHVMRDCWVIQAKNRDAQPPTSKEQPAVKDDGPDLNGTLADSSRSVPAEQQCRCAEKRGLSGCVCVPCGCGSAPAPPEDAVEPETMTWTGDSPMRLADSAKRLITWCEANGGEAQYVPHWTTSEDARSTVHQGLHDGPKIVITGPNSDVVIRPGDAAVAGQWFMRHAVGFRCREFTVRTPTGEQR